VVKKALLLSALLAVIWVVAMTGWSVAAHVTGAPGPAQVANVMFDAGSAALEAVEPPRSLSGPRRAAMRQLRTSRRIVLSILSGPERAGAAIAARWSERHTPPIGQMEVLAPSPGIRLPVVVIRREEEPIRIIVRTAEASQPSH
jgi:hypothetical protein